VSEGGSGREEGDIKRERARESVKKKVGSGRQEGEIKKERARESVCLRVCVCVFVYLCVCVFEYAENALNTIGKGLEWYHRPPRLSA